MNTMLSKLGIDSENSGGFDGEWIGSGQPLESISPIDGKVLTRVTQVTEAEYDKIAARAHEAFLKWRMVPAPKRGEVVRQLGNRLREVKTELGALVTMEMGKIRAEGEGEVQEMIDICDFAVGLSRQLYGKTMHSERPGHRMYEQWHPLGVVGIITAFNFPVAVWAWNAAIAAVCGDTLILKPSSKAPLCAVAIQKICNEVMAEHDAPGLFNTIIGGRAEVGEAFINDPRIPLVSATGSVAMGRHVGGVVGNRLGRTILELGGNNAVVVHKDADLDMATRAILFGAVGTAGQRCTTTRRVIVHQSIAGELTNRLVDSYKQVKIGDPLDESTLMGPLCDRRAVEGMMLSIEQLKKEGGEVLCGGEKLDRTGNFVTPCIVTAKADFEIVKHETFAPILYLIEYDSIEQGIEYQNGVPQGLSSAVFTRDLLVAEKFLSHQGSDCGIANVNIGTSGAEIGGAFGGEKDTGGGREAGSDSWKAYMRRQTNTINWSTELPLAQGIKFGE